MMRAFVVVVVVVLLRAQEVTVVARALLRAAERAIRFRDLHEPGGCGGIVGIVVGVVDLGEGEELPANAD